MSSWDEGPAEVDRRLMLPGAWEPRRPTATTAAIERRSPPAGAAPGRVADSDRVSRAQAPSSAFSWELPLIVAALFAAMLLAMWGTGPLLPTL